MIGAVVVEVVPAFEGTQEEFEALIAEEREAKERCEAEFLEAFNSGMVVFEQQGCDIGTLKGTVWHGTEYGPEKTAAHVASRFRAGWTRVKIADPSTLVLDAAELPKYQRISAWDGAEWRKSMLLRVEEVEGGEVVLHCCDWIGHPSFTWRTEADTPVYLI